MNKDQPNSVIPGLRFNAAGQAELNVWAPLANEITLRLAAGKADFRLQKNDGGYWSLKDLKIRPGTLYKISVDGKELPDPASLAQPEGVHGPSMAVDLNSFDWSDQQWTNYPLDDYIIYELHVGTFSEEGTFAALAEKIPHLKALGITAIEVMPVSQFPGERNWGYDGVNPYAVQNSYGGPAALQQLVNTCHQHGLAVILDVVYNHLGPEGNYLPEYGPYFTSKYATPWGNAINFDDAYCDGVRDYFIENALMWFRDFHIDALRLDAVHAIKDFSPVHILREIKLRTDALMQETGKVHYLITELDLNDTRFINPLDQHGYGMDAQWIDEFHHALRVTMGEERLGYYSDFNGIEHLAKSYRDAYVYDGQYSPHRNKKFGIKAHKNPGRQFIVFSQNHDQVGNRMLGERTSELLSFEMQKLAATAVMVSPFIPMLFMGEEWSEPHRFLYFVSHTDPELAEAVRKGRKEEFKAFHTDASAPDPMAMETFMESKLQWGILKQEPHQTMLKFYQALIRLRKSHPVLQKAERGGLSAEANQQENTLILQRRSADTGLICLMNFSDSERTLKVPGAGGNLQVLLNTADTQWMGPVTSPQAVPRGTDVLLQPGSAIILDVAAD